MLGKLKILALRFICRFNFLTFKVLATFKEAWGMKIGATHPQFYKLAAPLKDNPVIPEKINDHPLLYTNMARQATSDFFDLTGRNWEDFYEENSRMWIPRVDGRSYRISSFKHRRGKMI